MVNYGILGGNVANVSLHVSGWTSEVWLMGCAWHYLLSMTPVISSWEGSGGGNWDKWRNDLELELELRNVRAIIRDCVTRLSFLLQCLSLFCMRNWDWECQCWMMLQIGLFADFILYIFMLKTLHKWFYNSKVPYSLLMTADDISIFQQYPVTERVHPILVPLISVYFYLF